MSNLTVIAVRARQSGKMPQKGTRHLREFSVLISDKILLIFVGYSAY